MKEIPKGTSESIQIRVSDAVNRIDMGIELPEHNKDELADLKKSIEENGVEVPILVRVNGDGVFECIDGWHRLLISRELGRDIPATLLTTISDARALEIAFEENLSRRPMTQEKKKEIASYLFHVLKLSARKIAARLCIHHVTVARWLGPSKPPNEQVLKQKITNFFMNRRSRIAKIRESLAGFMTNLGPLVVELREEAERSMVELQDEISALSAQLSEALKALKALNAPDEPSAEISAGGKKGGRLGENR